MIRGTVCAVAVLSFVFRLPSLALALAPPSDAAVLQDPVAISLLSRMMQQTGWNTVLPTLADITVSATDTSRNSEGTPVTMQARPGANEFRYDISGGGGSIIRNGTLLRQIAGGGTTHYGPSVAAGSYPAYLPFLTPLLSFSTPTVPVRSLGPQTFDGQQVEAIDIGQVQKIGLHGQSPFTHIVVYLDASTSYPVGAIIDTPALTNPSLTLPITWHWGKYTQMEGVLVPASVEETTGSAVRRRATIQSIQLNTGLTDANF